jgi:hypothetical protein
MNAAIYTIETGAISRRISCPARMLAAQCNPGEEFYLNSPAEATHIIGNAPATITPAPAPPTVAELTAAIRAERNRRLTACDWTQLPDATGDKESWAAYRQALRDFPATCDITNPIWPTRS